MEEIITVSLDDVSAAIQYLNELLGMYESIPTGGFGKIFIDLKLGQLLLINEHWDKLSTNPIFIADAAGVVKEAMAMK